MNGVPHDCKIPSRDYLKLYSIISALSSILYVNRLDAHTYTLDTVTH